MPDEPYATRREVDMLISKVSDLDRRVDNLDRDGTRGVLAMQQQLTDAIKDMTEIKTDLISFKRDNAGWFKEHTVQHDTDQAERISGRRWLVGTALAGVLALATVIGLLIQVVQNLK